MTHFNVSTILRPQALAPATRALGVALTLLLLIRPLRAQAPVPIVSFEGSEIFCHILKHFKLAPIGRVEELPDYAAEETVIVIFGDLTPLDAIRKQVGNLDRYALLIASDRKSGAYVRKDLPTGFSGWRWVESKLTPWRLRIEGTEVGVAEQDAYKPDRRFSPLLKREHASPEHPVFRGISMGLATNRPSFLTSDGSDLHLLAEFPKSAIAGRTLLRQVDALTGYAFGTTAEAEQRVLILAGHGVFINGMIAQDDNDNGLFAIDTIRWLRGPGNQRKYALMIDGGKVVESFGLPLTQMPDIPLPPVQVINQMLRELENEGIVNRFLAEVLGWPVVLRIAILIGTIGITIYGFYRLFPLRHRYEAVPLLIGQQTAVQPARSLPALRQWELLMQDNLWEASQALAKQWFMENAGVQAPLWDQNSVAAPPAQIAGGLLARTRVARQVHELWEFALRDPSQAVSQREFRRLLDLLATLNLAVGSGRLSFAGAGLRHKTGVVGHS